METVDPMTDRGRGIAATGSDGPSIVIKCDASGSYSDMYVQFTSASYLGEGRSYGRRDLMYRFDGDAPVSETWTYDRSTAILTGKPLVEAFVRRLETARKVAVRASTYDYETVDAVIDVEGGREAIERAYRACGFTAPWAGMPAS